MEENTFVISGLRERRSAVAGRIVDMRREIDKLQADLLHLDAVLKLYGLEPAEISNKGRMPVRSAYFGRDEISRRCRDMLREKLMAACLWLAALSRGMRLATWSWPRGRLGSFPSKTSANALIPPSRQLGRLKASS